MVAVARARRRNDDSQLELLTLTPHGFEAAESLRAIGRGPLAEGLSTNGGGTGNQGTASDQSAASHRANGEGSGSDAPAIDATRPTTAASAETGLGNGADEIHLPPAGEIASGGQPKLLR